MTQEPLLIPGRRKLLPVDTSGSLGGIILSLDGLAFSCVNQGRKEVLRANPAYNSVDSPAPSPTCVYLCLSVCWTFPVSPNVLLG